jgi:LmbE family N-acetylglucosaminyl deacetylase
MNVPEGLLGRTLLVMAHPDDETAGAGVLLQRIAEPVVVFCTDGAPRDEFFWRKYGSRLRYARVRQEEAVAALSLAGVSEIVFLAEQGGAQELFTDQELYRVIPETMLLLRGIARRQRPQAVLALAYEGGHPDHDVCSFLASVLAQEQSLPCWEFPLYHRQNGRGTAGAASTESGKIIYQRFLAPVEEEVVLEITADEAEVKRQMIAAYSSQHPFLLEFDPAKERFCRQRVYDYARPPHEGRLNYEEWGWPVTGEDVCAAFAAFQRTGQRRIA